MNSSGGGFNTLVTITASCDWPAPVNGWYKFRIKGAGGGGAGGWLHRVASTKGYLGAGGGGGEGGTTIAYEYLYKGDIVSIKIGAGGTGGSRGYRGTNGNDSILICNNHTYIGGGGIAGFVDYNGGSGGLGGSGDIRGATGNNGCGTFIAITGGITCRGGSGGGSGANISAYLTDEAIYGSGGAGGDATQINGGTADGSYPGKNGADGVCWIEYFDPSKK